MEMKKNIRNGNIFFYLLIVGICFGLGYFLLASLDKILHPSIEELYTSVYTVYTEFGMIIFPVLMLQTISSDYKNKNILFYKLVGFNWLKYFGTKVLFNFCMISVPTIAGITLISILYNDFSYLSVMFLYFESVICFQVLLECMWGFLFKSMIIAYVVNFAYWLLSIIFATASESLSFFARYDAANAVYRNLSEYFVTHNKQYLNILGNCLYTVCVLIVIFVVIFANRRRWEKNGI